jgi:hypothetical protein
MLRYATLRYAALCCAVLCYAMPCYGMLCYAVLCYAMLPRLPSELAVVAPSVLPAAPAVPGVAPSVASGAYTELAPHRDARGQAREQPAGSPSRREHVHGPPAHGALPGRANHSRHGHHAGKSTAMAKLTMEVAE